MSSFPKIAIVTSDEQLKGGLLLEFAHRDLTVSLASSMRALQAHMEREACSLAIVDGRLKDLNILDTILGRSEGRRPIVITLLSTINPMCRYSLYEKGVFLCLDRDCAAKEIGIIAQHAIGLGRRSARQERSEELYGDKAPRQPAAARWELNRNSWELKAPGGEVVTLRHSELQLVELFAKTHPRILSREQIFSFLNIEESQSSNKALEARIHRLRKRVAVAGNQLIMTAYGVGWLLKEPITLL